MLDYLNQKIRFLICYLEILVSNQQPSHEECISLSNADIIYLS